MRVHELIVSHFGWIETTARRFCRDSTEAADLAGETIAKCLCHSFRFDDSRVFKPWVLTIMANTYKTLYNRKKCVPFTGYDLTDNFLSSLRADDLTLRHEIERCIMELENRSVCIRCVLLYIEGYNYVEIAEIVGICVGTVKSRMRDGRKMLRDYLRRYL